MSLLARSKGVLTILVALGALASSAKALAPPTLAGDDALRARYALPGSKFMEIEGQSIHYMDEGKGPAIVLLHGSFGSLLQWNGWAQALKPRYRVIRLDLPPAGLSGPAPDGDYSVERKLAILDLLTRRLGADRFLLVATSSGAISGAAFAAEHPERISGFIYSDASVGKVIIDKSSFSPALKRAIADDAEHKDYHLPEYWRQIMGLHFENQSKLTPELVEQWTQLNNRALRPAFAPAPGKSPVTHQRTPDDLKRITAPTLVLWAANDSEATLERDAKAAMEDLAASDKTLVVVPHCGHMMALDCGDRALALALPFIDRVTSDDQ